MTDRLPLAVLVSGAPGAGKTTLAAALGERLRLPVVHKDRYVKVSCLLSVGIAGMTGRSSAPSCSTDRWRLGSEWA